MTPVSDLGKGKWCTGAPFEKGEAMGNGYRKNARPRGTDEAEVIQVIHTRALVGRGTPEDLARYLDQYWSFDGKLLAVYDPAVEYDPTKVYDTSSL